MLRHHPDRPVVTATWAGSRPYPRRMHPRVHTALVALLLLLSAVAFLGAGVVGEHRRCTSLRNAGNPLAAQYCPDGGRP